MFARYAHAPNALGYCGPPSAAALAVGGAGDGGSDDDARAVRAAARRFSGAWPYLQVLARLTGIEDPLDRHLVESYWLGGGVNDDLDGAAFGTELLAVIGPQAGHYWSHLTPELLAEAAGDHSFHVFGVYPWTRLLGNGRADDGSAGAAPSDQHPLHVLDSCRIRWGTVVSRTGEGIEVSSRRLSWDGSALGLAEPTVALVPVSVDGLSFVPDVAEGDEVALHWDRLTDRLTPAQVATLEATTTRQLEATNARLAR